MAKHKDRLILVTGATGTQGGAVLKYLRQAGVPVRAMTRDPNSPKALKLITPGTEVTAGDFEDSASSERALDGVYGVFSVQDFAGGVQQEISNGKALADAANRQGVRHFVYTSVASAEKHTGIPHFESKFQIEEHIRATGLACTILRPVFFMENWLGMKETVNGGTLAQPLNPDTRLQMIAVDDIGAAAARVFEHPGAWQGKALDLASDERSMQELANDFGRMTGKKVNYVQVPWSDFESRFGHEYTVMYKWFQDVGYTVDIAGLREQQVQLTSFDRWLSANWRQSQRHSTGH
jgi:uncharacterized protein YbjT (DUF2867 family)